MNLYSTILLEFLLIASSILLLFKFRAKIGLAPLYIFLGAVQYLQANLGSSFSINLFGDYILYPGSIILFSSILFAVLLIYIKEGVASARALIIGIVISNFIMTLMFEITYVQQVINSQISNTPLDPDSVFNVNYKYFLTGSAILFLDFLFLIIAYQYLVTKVKNLHYLLILFVSLLSILIFDSVAYNVVLFFGTPLFKISLISHLVGKSLGALVFSITLYFYVKYLERDTQVTATFIANQNREVFSIFKYRERYINLKAEKEQVEKKLVSHIETTLNNVSDGFVSLDTNWSYTFVNIKAGEFLGRSPESLIGKHIWTEFPDGVGLPFYKLYYKAVETQETQYLQEYYEPFDKWFENRIYPSPEGLTIYFTDITEKKKVEIRNQMLLSLIETSEDFVGLASLDGNPIYLNANGRRLVGLSENEKLATSIVDFFPKKFHDSILNEHVPSIYEKNKWNGEVQLQNFKTGDLIPIEMSGFLIKDSVVKKPIALGIVARDITKHKVAEKELRDIQQKLEVAIRIGNIGYWSWDIKTDEVNWSDLMYEIYDVDRGLPLKYDSVLSRVHPEDREFHDKLTADRIKNKNKDPFDYRVLWRDNSVKYVMVQMEVVEDAEGNAIMFQGTVIDITERKFAESKIIDANYKFERAEEIASIGSWELDVATGKASWSKQIFELYGFPFSDELPSAEEQISRIHPDDIELLTSQFNLALSGVVPENLTLRTNPETVGLKYLYTIFNIEKNAEGAVISVAGSTQDITQLKMAEQALKESEKYLDNIINNIGDPFFVKDEQSRLLIVNDAFCTLFNISKDDALNRTLSESVLPEEKDEFFRVDKLVLSTGIENVNEERITIKGQETQIISTKKTRYIDDNGNKFLIGVIRDITERKKIDEEIRLAHQRLTTHLNNSPLAIIEWDKNLFIRNWSVQAENIFGWKLHEVSGKHFKDLNLVYEGDVEATSIIAEELMVGKVKSNKIINRNYTKTNKIIYCEWYNSVLQSPDGQVETIFSLVQDITEQKNAENEILALGNRNTLIIETLLDGFLLADTEGKILDANPSYVTMIGYTLEELLTMNINQLECALNQKEIDERINDMMNNGFARFQSNHKTKNGDIINLDVSTFTMQINEQYVVAAFMKDITERKKSEIALKENEEKFSKAFKSNVIGKAILNREKRIIEVNDALANIVGFKRENMLGKTAEEIGLFNYTDTKNLENEARLWREFSENGYASNIELKYLMNDGRELFILISLQALQLNDEDHVMITIVDITEKKNAETELEKYRNNLEELVKTRTEEVDFKNAELQRMNKLFVGRELKMKELKEIIKELQSKNEK